MFKLDLTNGIWIFLSFSFVVLLACKLLKKTPAESENDHFLPEYSKLKAHEFIKKIEETCVEIQQDLEMELARAVTSNNGHADDWQKDIMTLDNILAIVMAFKRDLTRDIIGECTEKLLQLAVHKFENELKFVLIKHDSRKCITDSLKELHGIVFKFVPFLQ